MKNIFVYCEIEESIILDVSLELLSKAKKLANELNCKLEAIVIGSNLKNIEKQIFPYGVDILHLADNKKLYPYLTLPHTNILTNIFKKEEPNIVLFGATSIGRDIAPRVASALKCGLTADCTSLIIGDYFDRKNKKDYKNLLYQIRPAFGGNIIATIINPEMHPQMATVREGVMKKEIYSENYLGEIKNINVENLLNDEDFIVKIIERHIEKSKINIKNSSVIVAGGYGVGSKKNFEKLFELQTGTTVRPKLYIACGISGAVQHRAGMDESSIIISINKDAKAPINQIADYNVIGDVSKVVPKMIKYYKKNSK
ncbi:MAG: electron transfer flavoprotein subunit alpha [Bacteroidetes bacterium 4572_128]|nr:MAG: electron transfer flavoprotein subunit alpha [Bacteroidetes bacterium 4572_128]